jgi:hypothetical protein
MKTYRWSGCIAPRINIGTRWRWVVSFTPRPLYSRRRAPGTRWIGGWVGPRAVLDAVVYRKKNPSLPLPEIEPRSSRPQLMHCKYLNTSTTTWKSLLSVHGEYHKLTAWRKVLREKLMVTQLIKKWPAFYGNLRFNTVFKRARHWSLSWVRWLQSTHSQIISVRSILFKFSD